MPSFAFLTDPPGRPSRPAVLEHARVRLTRDVVEQGGLYPTGSTGTVVYVYRDNTAFEVEITHPGHDVVTVEAEALEVVSP